MSTEAPAQETPETLELSERELAIARGENPDSVPAQPDPEPEMERDEPPQEAAADPAAEAGDTEAGDTEVEAAEHGSDAGQEPVKEDDAREGEGGKDAAGSWIDETARQMGQSYGLSEDDLRAFSNAEEFRRAAILFDRQLAASGQSAQRQAPAQPRPAQQPPPQQRPSQQPQQTPPGQQDPQEEIDLDPERYRQAGYDDETINLVTYAKRLRDKQEQMAQQVDMVTRHWQEQERQRQVHAFHSAVDQLDHDRFGRSIDEQGQIAQIGKDHDLNRRKLWEAAETLAHGIVRRAEQSGQAPQLPPINVLLKRAEHLAFADEIAQADRKRVQQAASAQSRRRRPVAGSRPQRTYAQPSAPQSEGDVAREIAENPDVKAMWDKLQAENGAQ